MRRLSLLLGLAFLAAGGIASHASAATFMVNRVADQVALGSTADAKCDADDGDPGQSTCTLRAAIQESNGTPGLDTIEVPDLGAPYLLTLPGSEDLAAGGDLDIRQSVTISGAGKAEILGAGADRVLHVGPTPTAPAVTITQLRIRGGGGVPEGGGIMVEGGTIHLQRVTVAGNLANAGASVGGGGIWIESGGSHAISDSTVSGNTATGVTAARGGGIRVGGGAILDLTNSTISSNGALAGVAGAAEGGGVWNGGSVGLTHATLSENTADGLTGAGGHVFSAAGGVGFRATILDGGNADPGSQSCRAAGGLLSTYGFNLEGLESGVGLQCGLLSAAGDRFSFGALIAPLADRGGVTETHALLNGSPALDVIPACSPISADQRGEPRPGAFACDIGSFERQVLPEPGEACLGRVPTIIAFAEGEKIVGTPKDDVIVAAGGNDKVKGGDGDDRICGGKGKDAIRGGPGDDRLDGEDGRDSLLGQAGADRLEGSAGKDHLDGGTSRDRLNGGPGKDNCRGAGSDKLKEC